MPMKKEKKRAACVNLPESSWKRIYQLAAEEQRSPSNMIRKLIVESPRFCLTNTPVVTK